MKKALSLVMAVCMQLSALFQRYVPADKFATLFGDANEGFGVLMAATIGVPLYACGGGTIPLIREWLTMGMKRFLLYLAFVMAFSLVMGIMVNVVI